MILDVGGADSVTNFNVRSRSLFGSIRRFFITTIMKGKSFRIILLSPTSERGFRLYTKVFGDSKQKLHYFYGMVK